MPRKTVFTILTFAALVLLPALKSYTAFDPQSIAKLIELPIPKIKPEPASEVLVVHPPVETRPPANLSDPAHALDHFYEALKRGGTVRILHYGDSPTTGDLITADARALLQQQYGNAGAGFVLIARPWAWYNHRGFDMDASHWKIDIAGIAQLKDGMHGLGGVSFLGSPGAIARWQWKGPRQSVIEVAYLSQPDGGAFAVDADDKELGVVETAADAKVAGYSSFNIPPGATKFAVRVTRGNVRLFGAEFRTGTSGVIYSSLGINGANVTLLSKSFNDRHWAAELRHYNPDLVIVNYGTNESGFADFVDKTWGPEMKEVVRRLHAALPETSVLLMSPMDRGDRNSSGEIQTTPVLPRLVSIEARVAGETGAAFFNTFEAMGGSGTMARWYTSEPRLVSADFIHPTPAGAKLVGELLYNALHDGFNQYKLRQLSDSSVAPKHAEQ
jgi:lysophospholipase L1-like esterase